MDGIPINIVDKMVVMGSTVSADCKITMDLEDKLNKGSRTSIAIERFCVAEKLRWLSDCNYYTQL